MIYSIRESVTHPVNEPKVYGAVYTEGTYVKNCDIFVTEQMVAECFGDENLVRQSAILEGAKMDMALKNFMKEGKDYKGLKKDLRDIMKANNMSDKDLETGKKGLLHACKRILQVLSDIESALMIPGAIISGGLTLPMVFAMPAAGIPLLIGYIVSYIVAFICSRLFRLLWDTIEFKTLKEDAESIVEDLRDMAKNTSNDSLKKKYNAEADRLEESIKKYSNKRKKEDD